jgi:hypothetical protein
MISIYQSYVAQYRDNPKSIILLKIMHNRTRGKDTTVSLLVRSPYRCQIRAQYQIFHLIALLEMSQRPLIILLTHEFESCFTLRLIVVHNGSSYVDCDKVNPSFLEVIIAAS